MRLTHILPWQSALLTPSKKDEKTGRPRAVEGDRGLSGVQVQSVTPPRDGPPDDEPPRPGGLDIKV
jgi:hypothetical protein